jgi:SpoVK/Ycf46/Vps4 family AAA+-type ATPase
MSRVDLIEQLVDAGLRGADPVFRKVVETMAAEARAKNYNSHARYLENALKTNKKIQHGNAFSGLSTGHENVPYCLGCQPRLSFSDLILPEHVVETCNEIVQEHTETAVLCNHNLSPRSKILLVGPPGNGKTSLAEALAGALAVPLFTVLCEQIIGSYLGATASHLSKLFESVVSRRCVLFFDEFETLAQERGSDHELGEMKRVVSSLLTQIDRLPSHVVVVTATNHPEMLDRAVRRRFQVLLHLPAPTQTQVTEFFYKFAQRVGEPFGIPVSELAHKIMGKLHNFAEIEEFAAATRRDYVLGRSSGDMRCIVERRLELLDRYDVPDDCFVAQETA